MVNTGNVWMIVQQLGGTETKTN